MEEIIIHADTYSDTTRRFFKTNKIGSRAYDLKGMRFGKLEVLKVFSKYKDITGMTVTYTWLCECDCGHKVVVRGNHLTKAGGTKSCGCISAEIAKDTVTNMNYARVGRWALPERLSASYVRKMRGYTDLTGKRVDKLTMVSIDHVDRYIVVNGNRNPSRKHVIAWNCVCDCGKTVVRSANSLYRKAGATCYLSCGCARHDRIVEPQIALSVSE